MKTFMMAVVSVDGKINRSERSPLDWTSKEDKTMFVETMKKVGVMILGHNTFETLPKLRPEVFYMVMSRKLHKSSQPNVEFTNDEPEKVLASLEKRGYKKVMIAGGSEIFSLFLKNKLIDEVWLTIEPKTLGGGIDLFAQRFEADLKLLELKKLNASTIFLKYQVVK